MFTLCVRYEFFELLINSFNEIEILFSITILRIPRADLLNAYGSFELVGFSLMPKKPTKLSILSASATAIEIFSFGTLSSGQTAK
jgi:hypothetical protein